MFYDLGGIHTRVFRKSSLCYYVWPIVVGYCLIWILKVYFDYSPCGPMDRIYSVGNYFSNRCIAIELFEAQQHIGLFSGLLLITYSLKNKIPFLNKGFVKLTYFLSVQMQKYTSSAMGSVVLGILNGLLPCGLSFGAAILSMNEPTTIRAALFMIIFGFGTTPLLGLVNLVPTFSWRKSWFKFQRYIPILLLVLGCLIVIRSMGLGVPYLSPTFDAEKVELSCCSSLPN